MHKFKLILALAWTLFMLVGSLVNNTNMPKVATPIIGFDKLIHTFCYFGLVVLWLNYVTYKKQLTFKTVLNVSISAFFLGIVVEFLQIFFTVDRSGDVLDVLANTIGILLGLLFYYVIKSYLSNSK